MEFDYDYIKMLAASNGQRVDELIALARANDPFYTGTPNDLKMGHWFARLWSKFGYRGNVHLRRVHYQIVSQNPPVRLPEGVALKDGPDGRTTNVYHNTEWAWDFLSAASKAARYLGLVDPAAFVDRRNPEPHIYMPYRGGDAYIDIDAELGEWQTAIPELPSMPDFRIQEYDAEQRYLIEIWCEKSTMNDVLLPLCRRYSANLVTGLGELSITATLNCLRRIEEAGKPARIFYVSDYDPAGQSMPVAVGRKIEYFVRRDDSEADIRLFPVLMTAEQIRTYKLPRTPIKATERRRESFEERHGSGAVELDALEALYPGELARLLSAQIERYYDPTLAERTEQARRRLREGLNAARARAYAAHEDEISAIRDEYEELRQEFENRLAELRPRMAQLWEEISESLRDEQPDIDDYPLPEARPARELGDGLYNSERDYLDQLSEYKQFQRKTS